MSSDTHKLKKIIKCSIFPILSLTLFSGTVCFWGSKTFGLALEYDGKQIATLSHENVYEEANHMVMDQLTPDGKYKVDSKYSQLKIVPVDNTECCSSPSEVKNKIIENSQDIFVDACGVYVNDKLIGVGENEESLKKMFDEVLDKQKELNPDKTVTLSENVELKNGLFTPEDVKSNAQLEKYFFTESEKKFNYTVSEGETISEIAAKFNIPEDIIRINNNITGENPQSGDVLVLTVKESILSFKFFKVIDEEKEIPFSTETITNDSQYTSWSETVQEGINGKEQFQYKVEYDKNGIEICKTELSHAIISEPTTQIIEQGTKEAPEGFLWPVPYTHNITSPFGPRWGTIHKGIDIAAAGVLGKDIVAADDGVVEKASNGSTGYGNHIIIKHDGTYSTLYGHCKELCVSVGDTVKKGQVIAKVGSTGDSTGPHLHFEIRVNGKQENPENYL